MHWTFIRRGVFCGLAVVALQSSLRAISVAPLFSEHAVLQRDRDLPVWGWAAPGEQVTVRFGRQTATTRTDTHGRWKVKLPPLAAEATGRDLLIEAADTLVIHDVCVGEVWLVAGQSNMAWKLSQDRDFLLERPRAATGVRQFYTQRTTADSPREIVAGAWALGDEQGAGDFSAVGWYFSQTVGRALGVTVGIINSTWGNTPIEAWLPPKLGTLNPRRLAKELYQRDSVLYNGMIYPHAPYAMRGTIWYQGESNVDEALLYKEQFTNLISSWRNSFQQETLSFYWVQLPSFAAADNGPDSWARLREAQTQALAVPHTGQAIALDQGDFWQIHPAHKREVGLRLARLALHRDYGNEVEDAGPIIRQAIFRPDQIEVTFEAAKSPLACPAARLVGFEVAGADRHFFPAAAKIVGNDIVVTNPTTAKPVALRYAWQNAPECNLYNQAGLPCGPFRTDNW